MFVKKIEIHGFKSFANKTVLEFLPPKNGKQSLTVVVGPNGSGKSNVSDAIRWVMGEQSMKHLRGKKSQDIIFAGSEGKGQMSMASVMMTLDNSDGRADIDFDELVVGRRIYRSGESEYLINGKSVRLLDVQLLLAKAQFGQGSYAIIGQGMIDRLLLQSSADRKAFFDEASGIKEFQIKRHQAWLRLNRTTEHLSQAELLLQEVTPRLKTLSRQVKKLEERKEIEIQLQEVQEQYYTTLWREHDMRIKALEKEKEDIDTKVQAQQEKLESTQKELAELAQSASRHESFAALEKEYQEANKKKNELERERAVLQGKLQTEYSKSGHHQLGWLEQKVQELQEKQSASDATLQEEQRKQETAQEEVTALSAQLEQIQQKRERLRSEIATLESRLLHLKSEQSAFQLSGYMAVQSVLDARHISGVHGIVAQLGEVDREYQLALDTAAGGKLTSIVVDDEDVAKQGVNYLRQERLGFATFLPLTKIRSRHLPHWIDDILGREGVHGLAQDLIACEERYDEVFAYVFGTTVVVEDFDTAKRIGIGRVRMVTLDGDTFETSGAVKGGYRKKKQGVSFASASLGGGTSGEAGECERDIQEKREELNSLEIQYETLRQTQQTKQAEQESLKNKYDLLVEQQHGSASELAKLEQELNLHTLTPEQYSVAMEDISSQKELLDQKIEEVEHTLADIQSKIATFNEQEEQKKQRVFALQDMMQSEQVALNQHMARKNEIQVSLAKLETKQEDLEQEVEEDMHTTIRYILDRGVESVEAEAVDVLRQTMQKLKYKLSLIGGIDEAVVEEYEETKARHDELSSQLEDMQKAMKDLKELIDELDHVMKQKRNKAFSEIKKEFARYFSLLFQGGKADLIEQYGYENEGNEDDELEGEDTMEQAQKKRGKKILKGIDIIACPPGKKIKHLQALSGGERTMTSIALMCAILKTNPPPFVMLDEVEAALDEANTLRVVNILKELASESQFIVITHNRVTMHAADALYGVTMGNDGISKLLSVKMEHISDQGEKQEQEESATVLVSK